MTNSEQKRRQTYIMSLMLLGVLASCALLMLTIVGMMFAPNIGNEKYFADESHFQTFQAEITDVIFYDNAINIYVKHSNEKFGDSMTINNGNATVAYENGAKTLLKEKVIVTVTVAPLYDSGTEAYSIAELKCGEQVLLPFETGQQNIVSTLKAQSDGISIILLGAGCALAVLVATGAIIFLVAKKKNIFGR